AITLNEIPFTSQNFTVVDAVARPAPPDPSRPQDQNAGAQQIAFKLQLLAPGPAGVEVDRTFTLYPDSPTIEVATQLIDNTPAPLRVGRYSLDELTTKATGAIEVQAYNGGTDWRDDYRHVV